MVLVFMPGVLADQTIIQPDATEGKDSYIQQDDPTMVRGTSSNIDLALHWQNSAKRGLLEFNLSSIPENSVVDSAILRLYMYNDGPGADVNISAHRVTQDWVEGTSGYSDNGATWNTYDGTNNWASSGGDFDASVEAYNITSLQNQYYDWDITNLVSAWYEGTYDNYGVLLKGVDETGDVNRRKRFRSSDYGTEAQRPQLIVDYTASDSDAPSFSNPVESPSNGSSYVSGQFYEFNITINDSSGISVAGIEFNGVNYTSEIRNII
jgi:hypothetical protein